MAFAEDTSVPIERSSQEIEFLVTKFGADQVGVLTRQTEVLLAFRYRGANYQFVLPMPTAADREVKFFPSGKLRQKAALEERIGQVKRARWRALALTVKAMMVGVEAGILDFGQVFLPYLVWGDGRTTWQSLLPVQERAEQERQPLPPIGGMMQLALPAGREGDVVDAEVEVKG